MSFFANGIAKRSDKQIAFFMLVFAFFLRCIYGVYYFYFQSPPETNLYYELAHKILEQGKFFYDTINSYYDVVGPVLPWINAFTILVFGKSYFGLYLVTSGASALTTYYTYKTARLFVNKNISIIIGIWSLFYFFYFYFTPSPGKDIWMAFFMIYLIYFFIKLFVINRFKYSAFILFVLMYVVSFHLDERYVVFAPFIIFYIFYQETNVFRKFHFKKTLLFIGLVILFMLPWSYRNYYKYDKIVILTLRTEPYTDLLLGYDSKEMYFSDDFTSITGTYYINDCQIDSVIHGEKKYTDAGFKIPNEWIEAMREGARPAPLIGVKAFSSRLTTMFQPFQLKGHFERTGYFYYKKSLRQNIVTFLFYGSLFFFAIPGFYRIYKINRAIFFLFINIIIIYALLHALTIPYTNWRYRLPLDSIFIITGIIGMAFIYKKTKLRNVHFILTNK